MKKKILTTMALLLSFMLCSMPAHAENVSDNSVFSVSGNEMHHGYVPSDIDYGFPEETPAGERAVSYPAKYDPRETNSVTSVKHQVLGSCWAYAAMAQAESNLIKKGYADSAVDLSEMQLMYFLNRTYEDPLGNYTVDLKDSGMTVRNFVNIGGLCPEAVSFFSHWTGPVYEAEAPLNREMCEKYYSNGVSVTDYNLLNSVELDASLANKTYWRMDGAKMCGYDTEHINNVKELITEYGAVTSGIYYSFNIPTNITADGQDRAYYKSTPATANHAVVLVGWDDNYSAENFRETPPGNGAWLMKNSYGRTSYAEEGLISCSGYVWVSYYDASLCDIMAMDFTDKRNHENIYAYDGNNIPQTDSFPDNSASGTFLQPVPAEKGQLDKEDIQNVYNSRQSAMNVYTAKAYEDGSVEKVGAVMLRLTANTRYKITVYVNPVIVNNKLAGYSGRSSTVTGKTDYFGYYTVNLSEPVYVTAGDTFGICVETDKYLSCPVTKQNAGECYLMTDLNHMVDAKDFAGVSVVGEKLPTPIIRGITSRVEHYAFSESVTLGLSHLSMTVGESTVLKAETLPKTATKPTAGFYSSNPDIVRVDENGTLTAVSAGSCTVTARSYDGKNADTMTVTVSEKQITQPVPAPSAPEKPKTETGAKVGSTIKVNGVTYKVKSKDTVAYQKGKNNATSATIPATVVINKKTYKVTEVSKNAFKGNKKLKKAVIGNNVKTIGSNAFYGCTKLKNVTIKSKVLKKIGSKAFKGNSQSITFKVPKAKKTAYKKLLKKCATTYTVKGM